MKTVKSEKVSLQNSSTWFLRGVALLMGLAVATLCYFVLPAVYSGWGDEFPEIDYMRYPILLGLSISAAAFFTALAQTLKLLSFLDNNSAFSEQSVKALGIIKYCALAVSVCWAGGLPAIYHWADQDDAPGLMVIGLALTFAPCVIAVFAAVLQRLLTSAMVLKSENDLTV